MSEQTAAEEEIVEHDALPVVADVRVIEPERPAGALAPAAQAAAVAGASFVAGVATVAAIKHARNRPAISRRQRRKAAKRGAQVVEVVSTRSFLVDVHLLSRE
ncbi:MAG TPA: hypothetical protein VGN78_13865 [Solirubrobacteraceae bacterium]|nr:hypothetical protein [Solirubrobacteraceae bacterium]